MAFWRLPQTSKMSIFSSIVHHLHTNNLNACVSKIYPSVLILRGPIHYFYKLLLFSFDYFESIIKKHETLTDRPPVQICFKKLQNKITFKIKSRLRNYSGVLKNNDQGGIRWYKIFSMTNTSIFIGPTYICSKWSIW